MAQAVATHSPELGGSEGHWQQRNELPNDAHRLDATGGRRQSLSFGGKTDADRERACTEDVLECGQDGILKMRVLRGQQRRVAPHHLQR